ncbi:MAG: hypothetical protein KDJ87_00150 [Rhizobiaceae bacterium]|nr:hypothetical protein [Rhizobiaceae bacterium]
MIRVTLGAKAGNDDFDVADIDPAAFDTAKPSYSITDRGITIASGSSDYVFLEGEFKLGALIRGDYVHGVKWLDSIKVVESGKLSYRIDNLDATGKDLASGAILRQFLDGETYRIRGNADGNEIAGAARNDLLDGLGGDDRLIGMAGNDRLLGGTGADTLIGGSGRDILSGGKGGDIFVFAAGDGRDIITDFKPSGRAHDLIDLSGHADVSSFDDLVIVDARSSVRIEVGEDTIVLKNVLAAQLDESDFLF